MNKLRQSFLTMLLVLLIISLVLAVATNQLILVFIETLCIVIVVIQIIDGVK